jgi:5'(3')-deoxyribonucleotidase
MINSERKTIGIDVDITLVDVISPRNGWFDWLNSISGCKFKNWSTFHESCCDVNGMLDYDLIKYFPEVTQSEGFSFWQQYNLYHKFKPHPDAVEVINELARDYNILFVSMCQSGHFKSKVQFLKDNFDITKGHFGFNATHEKHFSKFDILIDDRNKFLNQVTNLKIPKIKYSSIYTQCEELKVSVDLETNNWYNIGNYIKEYL